MAFKVDSSSDLISEFNLRKYQNEGNALVDGSEYLANVKEQVISFYFEPTGETVFFKAFITTFNDSFTPSYSTTQVFGRTDPIQIYQNTTRQISLAFQVPAASEGEAFENLGRVQKIIHMLYPGYANLDNALTLTEAPLTRIKVMNLLSTQEVFGVNEEEVSEQVSTPPDQFSEYYVRYRSTSAPDKGTLGVITSFTVNHNLENPQMGVFEKSANTILPKVIDVNLSFTPFHEETIGRLVTDPRNSSMEAGTVNVDDFTDRMKGFPYGVDLGNNTGRNLKTAGGAQTKAVALRRDAEEARRKASAAQQELDKVKATNRRVTRQLNRMNRRGEIDDVSTNQAKTSLALNQGDAAYDLAQAEREAQAAEQTYQDFIE
jgi:hypothetical protein